MNKTASLVLALIVAGAVGTAYWLGKRGAETSRSAAVDTPAIVGESGKPARRILYYRNPMGLPDTSPVPKKDPMGMDYTPVYENEDDVCAVPGKACKPEVQISAEKIQKLGVRSEPVAMRVVDRIVRAVGKADASERLIYGVSPRYEGWIEKVYVNAIYQLVAKDQPLIEVYSPELLSAQQEYVIAAEAIDRIKQKMAKSSSEVAPVAATDHAADHTSSASHAMPASVPSLVADGVGDVRNADADALAGMERLAESVLNRLRYWEVTEKQIEELKRTRKAKRTLVITARDAAFVVAKKMIFPGMAFVPGQEIYTMADLLTKVWVIADVFEQEMDLLKMGQAAKVDFPARPGQEFFGKIDYIYPILRDVTRTTQVRIEIENPTAQIFGAMYANVEFNVGKSRGKVVSVPNSAVISSGTRNIVLVQLAGGRFQPREVKLGMRGENYVEVREGVAEGENVVTSANFLIDSESSLKAALTGFGGDPSASGATPASVAPHQHGESPMQHDSPSMNHDMSKMPQGTTSMNHDMPAQPAAAHQGH